jgi:uncharacterized protein
MRLFILLFFCIHAHSLTALPVERLIIESGDQQHVFDIEVARRIDDIKNGLMGRKSLREDHGMLLLFQRERKLVMWMKNTPLNLDMIFIDNSGRITEIFHDVLPNSDKMYRTKNKARYVLEIKGGLAKRYQFKSGDKIITKHH